MDEIVIKDLTAGELESAAAQFKKQVEGVIDNVRNSIRGLEKLREAWRGPKYNYFIELWNTDTSIRLSDLLQEWDQKTNTLFNELVEQYKSVMVNDDFTNVDLTVDPEYYEFIKRPIEYEKNVGTYFAKEPVEKIIGWDIDGFLGGIAGGIRTVSGVLEENLSKGSSNAISMFKEKAADCTNNTFNQIDGLLKDYIGVIKTRMREVEVIEDRARANIQNI